MKNKKGFTLIELLAVLTLLGIIMIIAVPNVLNVIGKNKKETMVNDAKRLIAITQYEASINKDLLPTDSIPTKTHSLTALWGLGIKDLESDPDNESYDGEASYVKIVFEDNDYVYSVKLCGSKQHINETVESGLTSNDIVLDGPCS